MEKATFGAGCFWGVEATFQKINGVLKTEVGYLGGTKGSPTYQEVCSGDTGHAEVVQLEFDPNTVSYENLLEVFWENHNPTTLNRQGPDIGTQYRSAIFYHTEGQKETAIRSKQEKQDNGKYKKEIVTEITPTSTFHKAEEYHQNYLKKKGLDSCHF